MLFISKACCSLRRRRLSGALFVMDDWLVAGAPFELASEGEGEGTGDSALELQPLDNLSRGIFFAESPLRRRFLDFISDFFLISKKVNSLDIN